MAGTDVDGIWIDETDRAAMLAPQDWSFPVPIAYGPGRLAEIGRRCGGMGLRNPLIVTDGGDGRGGDHASWADAYLCK